MNRNSFGVVVLSAACALSSAASAQSPCPAWRSGFGLPGADDSVRAIISFDDGSGSALYLGGSFTSVGEIGAQHIARWNGANWSNVGDGFDGDVLALAVLDDGSGPALYAGGAFTLAGATMVNGIAKWNGTNWLPLGTGMSGGTPTDVRALCAFDDGSGVAIYAGGRFTHADGGYVGNVARWRNGAWSSIGGVSNTSSSTSVDVDALAVYNDGSGSALYVGGYFNKTAAINASGIARWNGAHWSALGANMTVRSFAVWDSGHGPELYVGAGFAEVNSIQYPGILRWSGAWAPVGGGFWPPAGGQYGSAFALVVHDDGSGEKLYAGGDFQYADLQPARGLARFDGQSWTPLATSLGSLSSLPGVRALGVYDDGGGAALFAGGDFWSVDQTVAPRIVRRTATGFNALGGGNGIGNSGNYNALLSMVVMGTDSGERLVVGGSFEVAGGTVARNIASFDGASWSALGSGTTGLVNALAMFDEGHGAGAVLFAAGEFTFAGGVSAAHIARWDGSAWSAVGLGTNDTIDSLAVFDDGSGPALYAAGFFSSAGGGTATGCVARWNGSAWSSVGIPPESTLQKITVFDDGSGPALYGFTNVYSPPNYSAIVYKWNGTTWMHVGGTLDRFLASLHVHDSGGQSKLYAGVNGVGFALWRLDGAAWTPIPGLENGINPVIVRAMATFDEGLGNAPSLIVAGAFSSAGGSQATNLARWDGAHWSAFDESFATTSPTTGVYALTLFNDPVAGGHTFVAVGGFKPGLGAPSTGIAERTRCYGPTNAYCFGDGSLTNACPCSNFGSTGHGCANSATASGAELSASGTPSLAADTIVLQQIDSLPHAFTIVLQGTATIAGGTAFGDGLRCVGGALKRLYTKTASGGIVTAPQPGDASVSSRSASLGDPLNVGSVRYHQAYYRDPVLTFCPDPSGKAFNVGNAVRVVWGP